MLCNSHCLNTTLSQSFHVHTEISVWSWKFGLKPWNSIGQHAYEPWKGTGRGLHLFFFFYNFFFNTFDPAVVEVTSGPKLAFQRRLRRPFIILTVAVPSVRRPTASTSERARRGADRVSSRALVTDCDSLPVLCFTLTRIPRKRKTEWLQGLNRVPLLWGIWLLGDHHMHPPVTKHNIPYGKNFFRRPPVDPLH